jgi:hypothetical protein
MDLEDAVEEHKPDLELASPTGQMDLNGISNSRKNPNIQLAEKEENISNKGEHDDGESSAKSFGSKKS